jgi:hypothetical protein
MDTLVINVPEKKTALVKQLLTELGVKIKDTSKAKLLAAKADSSILPGKKPSMDEIVAEVKAMRAGN